MGRAHSDDGFTLPELLVFMLLSGIVGTLVVTAVRTGFQQQRKTQARNQAITQARDALDRMDRDIRSTQHWVEGATASSITLTETEATQTVVRTYTVTSAGGNSDKILVGEKDNGVSQPTKTLISNLVDVSANPVFVFAPTPSWAAETGISSSDCSESGSSPTAYSARCIGFVTIDLHVEPSGLSHPVEVSDHGVEVVNNS